MTTTFGIEALLLVVVTSFLILAPCSTVTGEDGPGAAEFPATDLIIFNADGERAIGHARYSISADDGTELLRGESSFINGEHDVEIERLRPGFGGKAPTLISYEHSFFNTEQSLQRVSSLDVENGTGSCKSQVGGKLEDQSSNMTVPADTYAGAAQILFVVTRLRQGVNHIQFHSFNCMPGPKIVATEASMETGRVQWSMYSGELAKIELQPDLGWLDFLLTPFVQKVYAWFDPSDNWNYVGGIYDRFYKGPHILTVRAKPVFQARH